MYKCAFIVLLVIVCVNKAKGSIDETQTNSIENDKKNFTSEINESSIQKECSGTFNAKCLKVHVLSFIEDLNSREELPLLGGLSLVKEKGNIEKNPNEVAAELSRQFPGKPEEKLNRFLLYRLQDFLEGHSLRYKLLDSETGKEAIDMVAVGRRRRGGIRGAMGSMLAAGMMMKGSLGAAALAGLALLAGKAMTTALMSLLLSAIVALKSSGGKGQTTYEIITKPEISHYHSHSQEEQHEYDHGHHGYHRRAYDYDNSYNPYSSPS